MGEAVVLHDTTIDPNSDLGRQLVVDLARYREGLVDEKAIRKKFKLANNIWEALIGDDDELIRAVEAEAVRKSLTAALKESARKCWRRAPPSFSATFLMTLPSRHDTKSTAPKR